MINDDSNYFLANYTRIHKDIYNIYHVNVFFRGGELPLKSSKTAFWDSGWAKRSTQWANFLVGFGGPRPSGAHVMAIGHAHFPAKSGPIDR